MHNIICIQHESRKVLIYPVRIKYKVFRKVVLKVRTTTRVISLDKIYNGVICFIPYVNIQYTIYNIHQYIYISKPF